MQLESDSEEQEDGECLPESWIAPVVCWKAIAETRHVHCGPCPPCALQNHDGPESASSSDLKREFLVIEPGAEKIDRYHRDDGREE